MKRFLLILVALVAIIPAQSQDVTIKKGAESEEIDFSTLLNARLLCSDSEGDLWLTKSDEGVKGLVNIHDWHLMRLTEEMSVTQRLDIPMSHRCKLLAATDVFESEAGGRKVTVLLVDSAEEGQTAILRATLSLDSLSLDGGRMDTVARYPYGRKDHCLVWGSVSPSGQYLGTLAIVKYVEIKEYTAVATVYDGEMNILWTREYAVGTTEGIYVTDDGDMYTLGTEATDDGMRFIFNVMKKSGADTYGVTVECDSVHDMQIVNVLGSQLLCSGLFTNEQADPEDQLSSGIVSMAFDIDSLAISNFSMRFFQNEDMNIMFNEDTKEIQRELGVPMVTPLACLPMPYGAVVAFGHRHVLHLRNANGTVDDSWYAKGIHLVALKADGTIKWVRNIRRNDVTDMAEGMLSLSLFAVGDTVCMVKNEHRKEPDEYIITKEAHEYETGDKSNLVLYTVTSDGGMKKTPLEKKTKHALANISRRDDDTLLLLTVHGDYSRMTLMNF